MTGSNQAIERAGEATQQHSSQKLANDFRIQNRIPDATVLYLIADFKRIRSEAVKLPFDLQRQRLLALTTYPSILPKA